MKSILHKKQTKFFISILEINPRRCQWIDNPKWIINPGKQKMQMTALQMLLYWYSTVNDSFLTNQSMHTISVNLYY